MEDHCDWCGYDGRALSPAETISALRDLPAQVRSMAGRFSPEQLRIRPDDTTWCAAEYLGHLRDLMGYHRWLVERALAEVDPVIERPDPDGSVAEAGYASADPAELLGQFERRVERLAALLASLPPEAYDRHLRLHDGVDVRLVSRSALHEGVHHLLDLEHLAGH